MQVRVCYELMTSFGKHLDTSIDRGEFQNGRKEKRSTRLQRDNKHPEITRLLPLKHVILFWDSRILQHERRPSKTRQNKKGSSFSQGNYRLRRRKGYFCSKTHHITFPKLSDPRIPGSGQGIAPSYKEDLKIPCSNVSALWKVKETICDDHAMRACHAI